MKKRRQLWFYFTVVLISLLWGCSENNTIDDNSDSENITDQIMDSSTPDGTDSGVENDSNSSGDTNENDSDNSVDSDNTETDTTSDELSIIDSDTVPGFDTNYVDSAEFNMTQTISDGAQRTTLAFSAIAMMTGNLEAQSFFPPGKVADYTGFQYLRDNDQDEMGHNTSFLTRVAYNVIYQLNDEQFEKLKVLAVDQMADVELYGYKRFPLMKAFRRLLEGDIPDGSTGLDINSVKEASKELYIIDGQISFDRAHMYAEILGSLDADQKAYFDDMKSAGWNSWADISKEQVQTKMKGLEKGSAVAVMTYAGDLFSWYAGSIAADAYFCPERQGTYFGSFYMKDAPAIGHEGFAIDTELTATAGRALCEADEGYVTEAQALVMRTVVDTQRDNLYAGAPNIVQTRIDISILLRELLESTDNAAEIEEKVLAYSARYGELDGENNHAYATASAEVYQSMTGAQKTKLNGLRESIMTGTYADNTPYDFTVCDTNFLYSAVIEDDSLLIPYTGNTDYLFFPPK